MARPSSSNGFSLAQLEKLMQSRRVEVARLTRQRDKIRKKLDAIEAKIAAAAGGAGPGRPAGSGGGTRARNDASLQDVIHQVLSKASGPVSVGDIVDKV